MEIKRFAAIIQETREGETLFRLMDWYDDPTGQPIPRFEFFVAGLVYHDDGTPESGPHLTVTQSNWECVESGIGHTTLKDQIARYKYELELGEAQ